MTCSLETTIRMRPCKTMYYYPQWNYQQAALQIREQRLDHQENLNDAHIFPVKITSIVVRTHVLKQLTSFWQSIGVHIDASEFLYFFKSGNALPPYDSMSDLVYSSAINWCSSLSVLRVVNSSLSNGWPRNARSGWMISPKSTLSNSFRFIIALESVFEYLGTRYVGCVRIDLVP